MSAFGTKRTSQSMHVMSAFGSKADIDQAITAFVELPRRLAMTHGCRKPLWDGSGRVVSFAVQLSDIARHFHTGDEFGVTRFSSCLSASRVLVLDAERTERVTQDVMIELG